MFEYNRSTVKSSNKKRKKRLGVPSSHPLNLTPGEALNKFANSPATRYLATTVVERAWQAAYEQAGSPHGVLPPDEGYRLALLFQDTLKGEMRRICAQFPADALFFSARMWSPGVMGERGFSFGVLGERDPFFDEKESLALGTLYNTTAAMAVRKVIVAAALLYGGSVPKDGIRIGRGNIPPDHLGRFVACFVALMNLSRAYTFAWAYLRASSSMGYKLVLSENGIRTLDVDEETLDILTFSSDMRRNAYLNLLSRVGEFGKVP